MMGGQPTVNQCMLPLLNFMWSFWRFVQMFQVVKTTSKGKGAQGKGEGGTFWDALTLKTLLSIISIFSFGLSWFARVGCILSSLLQFTFQFVPKK